MQATMKTSILRAIRLNLDLATLFFSPRQIASRLPLLRNGTDPEYPINVLVKRFFGSAAIIYANGIFARGEIERVTRINVLD